jgi:hypothetical protein
MKIAGQGIAPYLWEDGKKNSDAAPLPERYEREVFQKKVNFGMVPCGLSICIIPRLSA